MAQLTWHNIDAPDLTGASNMMEQARKTVSGSLTGLSEILDKEAALQATNAKAAVQRNTQAGLNQIAQQYGTAAELEEALRNGGVQKIADSYGGMIDEQQLGAQAMQQRIGQLRQSDLSKANYDEVTKKIVDRKKFDSFLDIAATNDIKAAVEFTKQNELGEYGKNAYDVIGLMRKNEFDQEKYRNELGIKQAQEARAKAQEARQAALHTRQMAGLEREDANREAIEAAQIGYFQASAKDEQANQQRMVGLRELEGQLQQLIAKKPTTPMEMQEKQEQYQILKDKITVAQIPITSNMDAFQSSYLEMAKQGNRAGIVGLQGIEQARGATQSLLQFQDEVDPRQQTEMTETLGRIDDKLNKTYAGRQLLSPMKDTDYYATVLKALEGNADFVFNSNNQKVVDQTIARAKEYMAYIPPEALAARIAAGVKDRSIFNSGTGLAKEDFENLQSEFAGEYQEAQTLFGERNKVNQAMKGRVPDTSGTTLEQADSWAAELRKQLEDIVKTQAAQARAAQTGTGQAGAGQTTLSTDESAPATPIATKTSTGHISLDGLRNKATEDVEKLYRGASYSRQHSDEWFKRMGEVHSAGKLNQITAIENVLNSGREALEVSPNMIRVEADLIKRGVGGKRKTAEENATDRAAREFVARNHDMIMELDPELVMLLGQKLGITLDAKTRKAMRD